MNLVFLLFLLIGGRGYRIRTFSSFPYHSIQLQDARDVVVDSIHIYVLFMQLKENFFHVFFITGKALHYDHHPHEDLVHLFANKNFNYEI